MKAYNLSIPAWDVLVQLKHGECDDGDIVSKTGRKELISCGLAKRYRCEDCGHMHTKLTPRGMAIAAHVYEYNRPIRLS